MPKKGAKNAKNALLFNFLTPNSRVYFHVSRVIKIKGCWYWCVPNKKRAVKLTTPIKGDNNWRPQVFIKYY